VAAGGEVLSARHRAALRGLAASSDGTRRIDLPGGSAVREYEWITFARGSASAAATPPSRTAARADIATRDGAPTPLVRGGLIDWQGWRVALDLPSDGLPFTASLDAASASRVQVRARRPGDRIAGRGKLQDVFVDAKVPTRLRDAWPVVTLGGTVIWVPGLTPAPHTGAVPLAAGPVETTPTPGEAAFTFSSQNRQVASKSVARPRGEKRGRP